MPRRELIEKVLSGLPAGSDSVAYPDHPLLLQGPDVLASVGGSLTAYFVQDQSVKNFPEKVLPKVMLSRLALPREASFVLVLNESTTLENEELPLFDEVVEVIKQGRQRMPAGRIVGSIVSEAVEHLREPHHERFAEAWTATIKGRRATRFEPGEPTSVYGIGSSSVYGIRPSLLESRYMDFQDGKFVFYPPEATKGKTL